MTHIKILTEALSAHCLYLLQHSNLKTVIVGTYSYTTHDNSWGSIVDPQAKDKFVLVHVLKKVGDTYQPGWEWVTHAYNVYDRTPEELRTYVQTRGIPVDFRGEFMLNLAEFSRHHPFLKFT